jgi:hypothetical protein
VDVQPGGEGRELVADLLEALLGVPADQVHLVHAARCGGLEQRGQEGVPRVCSITPLRASTSTMARLAVEAPVTMLRVYWMCPGVSAMMNLRLAVAK